MNYHLPPELVDPTIPADLSLEALPPHLALDVLERMILIRLSEECIAKYRQQGLIKGPVHLCAGQEAVPAALSCFLSSSDAVFGAHRSHGHFLALNHNPYALFAEVLARSTGCSKGRGGSMHLIDKSHGFYGSVPIVAGTVPLAVGTALSFRLRSHQGISVAFLGDGAMEEGVVHESLNFASLNLCPILFVVENNLFSSHMHLSMRQPFSSVSRFAEVNQICHRVVDGNNASHLYQALSDLTSIIRETSKPAFLEAVTFRHYGHVDWRQDVDVGVHRSSSDIQAWHSRDPIKRLSQALIRDNHLTEATLSRLLLKISNLVDQSWERALSDPLPSANSLLQDVYSH